MNKTLHSTFALPYNHTYWDMCAMNTKMFTEIVAEMRAALTKASRELLSPNPKVIARILMIARAD